MTQDDPEALRPEPLAAPPSDDAVDAALERQRAAVRAHSDACARLRAAAEEMRERQAALREAEAQWAALRAEVERARETLDTATRELSEAQADAARARERDARGAPVEKEGPPRGPEPRADPAAVDPQAAGAGGRAPPPEVDREATPEAQPPRPQTAHGVEPPPDAERPRAPEAPPPAEAAEGEAGPAGSGASSPVAPAEVEVGGSDPSSPVALAETAEVGITGSDPSSPVAPAAAGPQSPAEAASPPMAPAAEAVSSPEAPPAEAISPPEAPPAEAASSPGAPPAEATSRPPLVAPPDQVPPTPRAPVPPKTRPPVFRLPNGSQGLPYDHPLEPPSPDVRVERVRGLEGTGLAFEGGRVTGTLARAGELRLTIEGQRGSEPFASALTLIANPDPKTLWKEREPEDPRFPKPHLDARHLRTGELRVLGASRRGRSHAHNGAYREDDFAVASAGGWLLLAVSDGAGSASMSRLGSALICRLALERVTSAVEAGDFDGELETLARAFAEDPSERAGQSLRRGLWPPLVANLAGIYRALVERASAEGLASSDLAGTLLFTMCRRFDFGWLVIGYGVGDGVTAIHRAGEAPLLLIEPDGGEFAGQTRFVTMRSVWENQEEMARRLHFHVVPRFDAIASMTDGVSDPLFETDRRLRSTEGWARFFEDLHAEVDLAGDLERQAEALLEWLSFFKPGEHDDRTLVLVEPD